MTRCGFCLQDYITVPTPDIVPTEFLQVGQKVQIEVRPTLRRSTARNRAVDHPSVLEEVLVVIGQVLAEPILLRREFNIAAEGALEL